jgi:hypothetical protein
MTPELLDKIGTLVRDGAIVIGSPPLKSPSLEGYPECDRRVRTLADGLWGGTAVPERSAVRIVGRGRIVWGGEFAKTAPGELYPAYDAVAAFLDEDGAAPDFTARGVFRYAHRTLPEREVYFVSNRTDRAVTEACIFRDGAQTAELWDAVTGEIRTRTDGIRTARGIALDLRLEPFQSCFVVFDREERSADGLESAPLDSPEEKEFMILDGPWTVAFDPRWGGPGRIVFNRLEDWSQRPESGIRYYSGIATYFRSLKIPEKILGGGGKLFLDLGTVREIARIRLNGKDLGIVWTAPWRVEITDAVRSRGNRLEIEVANLWPNRLIGDEELPDDGIADGRWPDWLINGAPRMSGRFTFTTNRYYKKGNPLLPSGLLGPVSVLSTAGAAR